MCTETNKQCPHFEANTIRLRLPDDLPSLAITVPRCGLAEAMRVRLNTTSAGQEVAKRLITTPQGGETRMMYGPDIQPIATPICFVERLQQRCAPEFIRLLTRLDMDASVPLIE